MKFNISICSSPTKRALQRRHPISTLWDLDEMNSNLKRIMLSSFSEVWNRSLDCENSMRQGAFMLGFEKIGRAIELRGIFP